MLSEGDMQNLSIESIISALEAVLIEAIEPAQNRRRGDQLSAVEYLQVSDPEKDKQKVAAISALISGMVVDGG